MDDKHSSLSQDIPNETSDFDTLAEQERNVSILIRGSVVLKKIKTQCSISSSTSLQNSHNHNYHPTLTRPKSLALYLSVPSRIK